MDYLKYKDSRDLAWQILIKEKVTTLPVKISKICQHNKILLYSYQSGKPLIDAMNLQTKLNHTDAFSVHSFGEYKIFFNNQCTPQRNRFSVAHELGHIFLGHMGRSDHEITTRNREPSSNDDPLEQQANIFAARLLAPACVLWAMNIRSVDQIMRFCDISYTAAKFRKQRLDLLYKREQVYFQKHGRSSFLLSPLERQVFEQFREYIERHKIL